MLNGNKDENKPNEDKPASEKNREEEKEELEEKDEIEEISEAQWSKKSHLEKTLSAGIHGAPELKKEEKSKHLGQFRERIIKALTLEQVHEEGVYPEIIDSIKDPRAAELIISLHAELSYARDYIMAARKHGLEFTTVSSPGYKGEIGLVVASREAVDEPEIMVPTLREKLIQRGVPASLADARGEKICRKCYRLIKEKAPEHIKQYRPLSWWDTFMGKRCPLKH